MDEIKEEGLRQYLCESCLNNQTYRLDDGQSESWWCPHTMNLVIWAAKFTHKVLVFPNVTDTEFFSALANFRDAVRAQRLREEAQQN